MIKKQALYGFLLLLALTATLLLAFTPVQKTTGFQKVTLAQASLMNVQERYVAGDEIRLTASVSLIDTINMEHEAFPLQLYIASSYGSSLLDASINKGAIHFQIPSFFARKSGVIQWELIHAEKVYDEGNFMILPDASNKTIIESYVGPPSIIAGGNDYTMLVTAATDVYDNLLPNDTEIFIKHYQNGVETTTQLPTEDRIAWKRVFSSEVTGKITFAATQNKDASKELVVEVLPNIPNDFTIEENRVHNYADGNQIVTFRTSQIVDAYNNVIADGTLVIFSILSSEGTLSRTSGTTINGVAQGQLLHPAAPTQWQINATIDGMAQSNALDINFEPFLLAFNMLYSEAENTISVGPLTSFMGQLIPDGAEVTLSLPELGIEKTKTSLNGMVTFEVSENEGDHTSTYAIIETLGISQSIKLTKE